MNTRYRSRRASAWLYLAAIGASTAHADALPAIADTRSPPAQETSAMHHVTGRFEVKLEPKPIENQAESTNLARLAIEKQFHGALEATSRGNMLSAGTSVKGSAGYVAIERVTGSLEGRAGSFVLQHSGTLTRGVPSLSITVVPDSGTDALTGLRGSMAIRIEPGGEHFYDFDYSIEASAAASSGSP